MSVFEFVLSLCVLIQIVQHELGLLLQQHSDSLENVAAQETRDKKENNNNNNKESKTKITFSFSLGVKQFSSLDFVNE